MFKSNITRNYIYSVLYQILIIVVPLITAPYLTRIMGATNLGVYSYTNSVAYYFYLFAMLGISNYGNRTIASVRDDKSQRSNIFCELIYMQIFIGILVSVMYVLYLFNLALSKDEYFLPSIIWIMYVISGAIDITWFFWGIEKFSITVQRNIIIKILITIGVFIFVKDANDLLIYIVLNAGGFFVSAVILWIQVPRYITFVEIKLKDAFKHFKSNLVLFIPVIAVSIYTVMDKVMLGNYSSMDQLGFYDNIQKIMTLPTGIITALGTVMLPRISNLLAKGNRDYAISFISMAMQFSNFFSIALCLGLAAIAPCFTTVYFGLEFSETSTMMELFCITIIFISWANVIRTQFLIPSGNDKAYIISVLVGALSNFIINSLLISKLGAIGAVWGTICAEFVVAFLQTIFVKKELPIKAYLRESVVFIFPGIMMFISVRIVFRHLGLSVLSLIIQIIVGILVYLLIGIPILISTRSLLSARFQTAFKRNIYRDI